MSVGRGLQSSSGRPQPGAPVAPATYARAARCASTEGRGRWSPRWPWPACCRSFRWRRTEDQSGAGRHHVRSPPAPGRRGPRWLHLHGHG